MGSAITMWGASRVSLSRILSSPSSPAPRVRYFSWSGPSVLCSAATNQQRRYGIVALQSRRNGNERAWLEGSREGRLGPTHKHRPAAVERQDQHAAQYHDTVLLGANLVAELRVVKLQLNCRLRRLSAPKTRGGQSSMCLRAPASRTIQLISAGARGPDKGGQRLSR